MWSAAVNERPLSVTIVAGGYIAVGFMGVVFDLRETLANHDYRNDSGIELSEIAGLVSGAFLLRGHNWARWLALAWMLFHVVSSAFNSLRDFGYSPADLRLDCLGSLPFRRCAIFSQQPGAPPRTSALYGF